MTSIVDRYGNPMESSVVARQKAAAHAYMKARYDAAITNAENEKHWSMADGLDANAANSPHVRAVLRNRSRYEFANNSFLNGMLLTKAFILIGRGPKLRIRTKDKAWNYAVEWRWGQWAKARRLSTRLRTAALAKYKDGELFLNQITNRKSTIPVSMDFRVTEPDQIAHPGGAVIGENQVDGIEFDADGNPSKYFRLKTHPGSLSIQEGYDTIDAADMIHWFREDRANQKRGIPETTPSLPLYSQNRRWTLATLGAAETAADLAAVMQTDMPPGESADLVPDATMDIERRTMQILPPGWKVSQLKAEHPGTTYKEFKQSLDAESARSSLMPYNVAAGNSSGFNFASGRLDTHGFATAIDIERDDFESIVLDRLFWWWFDEAILIEGYLPKSQIGLDQMDRRSWGWDSSLPVIDPSKQANANKTRLMTGTASREQILSDELNVDIDEHDERTAEEYGLTVPELRRRIADAVFGPVSALPTEPENEDETEEEEEEVDA